MAVQLQLSSDASGTPVANSATGDRFTVRLSTPLVVDPADLDNYGVQVVSAAAWYTSPNVSAALGNNAFTYISDTVAPTGTFNITIPDGLYTVQDLTSTVASFTTANGHGTQDNPLFTFVPLVAEQKVSITVDKDNLIGQDFSIDGTVADAMIVDLLGFTAAVFGPTTTSPETFKPTNLADMGQGKNEYLIQTDLIRGSIGTGGNASNAILRLPLNAPPNSQVTYQSTLDAVALPLSRARVGSVDVWITDGNGTPITLNSNPFSINLAIVRLGDDDVVRLERQI